MVFRVIMVGRGNKNHIIKMKSKTLIEAIDLYPRTQNKHSSANIYQQNSLVSNGH